MVKYCGRQFSSKEIQKIRDMRRLFPNENRTMLTRRICREFNWLKPDGGLKDMSCRVALLRMEKDSLITLPSPQTRNGNGNKKITFTRVTNFRPFNQKPVGKLSELVIKKVSNRNESILWNEYIERYHYLKYSPLPGVQIRYIVSSDNDILALLGFGASAWMVAARDNYIGWNHEQRKSKLHLVEDWKETYNYSPVLLETFVYCERFTGAIYKAANWIYVGETRGRGKLEKQNKKVLPIKYIFLYPLVNNFREILCC